VILIGTVNNTDGSTVNYVWIEGVNV